KAKTSKKRSRFRFADAKVSTTLMLVLTVFMLLILAVGGMGAWFLQSNLEQFDAVQRQNKRAQAVQNMGTDMLTARVSLLVAARYQQEAAAAASSDAQQRTRAQDALAEAKAKLADVNRQFDDFRKDVAETAEGKR